MDCQNDLNECLKLKKQLKIDFQGKRMNFPLRAVLQQKCEDLMRSDAVFSEKNNVIKFYWKICFYEVIDYYRRGIKHFRAKGQRDGLAEISESYKNFLGDSISCLKSLLKNLLKQAGVSRCNKNFLLDELGCNRSFLAKRISKSQLRFMRYSLQCCFRLYIFLGDLERYRELENSNKRLQQWNRAVYCYECAISIDPSNGNPYNQLAIIASYDQNTLSTLYHYARSLSVPKKPFAAAKENFYNLLDKNAKFLKNLFYKSNLRRIEPFLLNLKSTRLVFCSVSYLFHLVATGDANAVFGSEIDSFASAAKAVLSCCGKYFFGPLGKLDYNRGEKDKILLKNALFEILVVSLYLFRASCRRPPKRNSRQICAFLWLLDFLSAAISAASPKSKESFLFLLSVFVDFSGSDAEFRSMLAQIEENSPTFKIVKKSFLTFWAKLLALANLFKTEERQKDSEIEPKHIILPEERELRGFWPMSAKYCENAILAPFARRRVPGADLSKLRFDRLALEESDECFEEFKFDFKRKTKIFAFLGEIEWVLIDEKTGEFAFDENFDRLYYEEAICPEERNTLNETSKEDILQEESDGKVDSDDKFEWRSRGTQNPKASKKEEKKNTFKKFVLTNMVGKSLSKSFENLDLDISADTNGDSPETPKTVPTDFPTDPSKPIAFNDSAKLQRDLVGNGYCLAKASELAQKIKRTLEKMNVGDFLRIERATLKFRPYFEAEKDALRNSNDIANELNAFKRENFQTMMNCETQIRASKRVLLHARERSVRLRAQVKLDHFVHLRAQMNDRALSLFSAERSAKNELDRAHFVSFAERKKVYHPELNVHMIDDKRFRNLAFLDIDDRKVGDRGGTRVAVSLGEGGEARYHAFVRNHKYSFVPSAPESAVALEAAAGAEGDWRAEFR